MSNKLGAVLLLGVGIVIFIMAMNGSLQNLWSVATTGSASNSGTGSSTTQPGSSTGSLQGSSQQVPSWSPSRYIGTTTSTTPQGPITNFTAPVPSNLISAGYIPGQPTWNAMIANANQGILYNAGILEAA